VAVAACGGAACAVAVLINATRIKSQRNRVIVLSTLQTSDGSEIFHKKKEDVRKNLYAF
jgi:hypothetical protein